MNSISHISKTASHTCNIFLSHTVRVISCKSLSIDEKNCRVFCQVCGQEFHINIQCLQSIHQFQGPVFSKLFILSLLCTKIKGRLIVQIYKPVKSQMHTKHHRIQLNTFSFSRSNANGFSLVIISMIPLKASQ